MAMGVFNLLFTTKGRLARAPFWLAHIVFTVGWLFVVFGLLAAVSESHGRGESSVLPSLGNQPPGLLIMMFLLSYMSLCVSAKRLHDRDKSAWWMLAFQGPTMVLWVGQPLLSPPVIVLLYVAVWIGAVWFLIELGFCRGTDGPNRFDHHGAGSPSGSDGGPSWADKIQFPEAQPSNPAAPRIPVAKLPVTPPPQLARAVQPRGPAKPIGFGRRGLKPV